jgi:hypothetical protein
MAIQTAAVDMHLRSSQAMNLLASSPFSITVWINATWNGAATASMVGIYGPATDTPLGTPVTALQIGTRTGTYQLDCWTWGGGVLISSAATAMTGYNGVWVFITYTFDGTNHRLYRNGVLLTTTTTAQLPGYLNQVYINGFPTGVTSEVAAFQVDQYSLFNRTLGADEILTIYNAGGARHGIVNGLLARFEFDELGQGASVVAPVDLSGKGSGLAPTGAGAAMTYAFVNTYANSNIRPVLG